MTTDVFPQLLSVLVSGPNNALWAVAVVNESSGACADISLTAEYERGFHSRVLSPWRH